MLDPTHCINCDKPHTDDDVAGGRCTGCFTRICAGAAPEPAKCVSCGSEGSMEYHTNLSVNGEDGLLGWICPDCGHTHLSKDIGASAPKRTPHDVVEEWSGVCSEACVKDPHLFSNLLADFIQERGLTDALDGYLHDRIVADDLSDPAAE